jgi:hypothetical protein
LRRRGRKQVSAGTKGTLKHPSLSRAEGDMMIPTFVPTALVVDETNVEVSDARVAICVAA